MKQFPLLLVTVISVTCLSGCNPFKDSKAAEKAVIEFHTQYNNNDFQAIYNSSHPDFKKSASIEDFNKFIQAVRNKLGKQISTNLSNTNINTFNLKTNVVLTYQTTYERGKGTETFTFRMDDDSAILLGWNINSRDLIVNETEQDAAANP